MASQRPSKASVPDVAQGQQLDAASCGTSRWRTRISIPFSKIGIFTLMLELLFASHWLACLLSLQARELA